MAYCSEDGCYRQESCGPFCRDSGGLRQEGFAVKVDEQREGALRLLSLLAETGTNHHLSLLLGLDLDYSKVPAASPRSVERLASNAQSMYYGSGE